MKENSNSKSYINCITNEDININKIKKDKIINIQNFRNEIKKNSKDKTFCSFLLFTLACGKRNQYYNIYINFRKKLISEEHLIRNHLNIYNLLRITKGKNYHKNNSYQFDNLINLL